jgi:hypothetical protein
MGTSSVLLAAGQTAQGSLHESQKTCMSCDICVDIVRILSLGILAYYLQNSVFSYHVLSTILLSIITTE